MIHPIINETIPIHKDTIINETIPIHKDTLKKPKPPLDGYLLLEIS